ncbi:RNase III [Magnetospirillum sp. LM-5]|uniref:ribonuclease III n=1 Tax=Magnetospirillum sp. LM-5 TaxID=2681466 RepID=UPI00137D5093|nr:ribonuclease III [Magnetospirillum sp. LM-5]CAA7613897.1 RNase III [Magnetospirillum sp. LM-5]
MSRILADRLGYAFTRPDLLSQALTHPSVTHGRAPRKATAYERLEFLGDRVLGLVVAEMLFHRFPTEAEGELARRHAALVRRDSLARIAVSWGIPDYLLLARGEEEGGGRANPAVLADACEAVIGAVFADGGLDPARRLVLAAWAPLMEESPAPPKDAKTALQEWAQGLGRPLPAYETQGVEGPPHEPVFLVSVTVEGEAPVLGRGRSKRSAEQAAATALLKKVKS